MSSKRLDRKAIAIRDTVPRNVVIAHRGLSHWAPEETAPAYELARDIGADYLEADLQRTRDGVIIALHDETLGRMTDIERVFPNRRDSPVASFTLEELKRLDAGSWFNEKFPERARRAFVGLKILTLDELLDIAEGGEHHPGVYLETKKADLHPGIERDLHELLSRRGWVGPNRRPGPAGLDDDESRVDIGYTAARVILQTFEKSSLPLLERYFPDVPKLFLVRKGKGHTESVNRSTYEEWVDFAIDNGAHFIGPSAPGAPHDYHDLLEDWMIELIHARGLFIHPYTLDTREAFDRFVGKSAGHFTNRADLLLQYHGRAGGNLQTLLERM